MHFPPLWDALFQLSWRQAWGFDWWSDVCTHTYMCVCTHLTIKHTVIQHLLLEGMFSLFCSLLMGSDLSCYIKLLNDFSGTHTHTHTRTHTRSHTEGTSKQPSAIEFYFFFLKEILQIIINGPKKIKIFAFLNTWIGMLLLLLSHFSRVWLCATPQTAAHQAPLSLGFSRQEHWSGLPFPSPMHESEKWKWSCSVMSNS